LFDVPEINVEYFGSVEEKGSYVDIPK